MNVNVHVCTIDKKCEGNNLSQSTGSMTERKSMDYNTGRVASAELVCTTGRERKE